MKPSRVEMGPYHLLAEFVCEAIPASDMKSNPDAASKNRKKKTGKSPKAANGKSKAKNQKATKSKRSGKKRPPA